MTSSINNNINPIENKENQSNNNQVNNNQPIAEFAGRSIKHLPIGTARYLPNSSFAKVDLVKETLLTRPIICPEALTTPSLVLSGMSDIEEVKVEPAEFSTEDSIAQRKDSITERDPSMSKTNRKIIVSASSEMSGLVNEAKDSSAENFKILDLPNNVSVISETGTGQYKVISKAPPIKNLAISGGGAKGVVYQGFALAIEEFQTEEGSFRDQLERISGASVGSLTGALIAAGVSAENIVAASNDSDLDNLTRDGAPLIRFMREQMKGSIKEYFQAINPELMRNHDYQNIRAFLSQQTNKEPDGVKICLFRNLLEEINKEDSNNVHITFAMLDLLHELDPKKFKQLTVTATCREKGETFYFNGEKTPNLDISIACIASAAHPALLSARVIEARSLRPGYGEELSERDGLTFIDGGYFNNTPFDVMEHSSINRFKGENEQNLQTLVLIFDETKREISQEGVEIGQSPYYEADVHPDTLYKPSFVDKILADFCMRRFGGLRTNRKYTQTAQETLSRVQKNYSQRVIPFRLVLENEREPLGTTDIRKAKKYAADYIEIGKNKTKEYLEIHKDEAIVRDFNSPEEVISYLSEENLSDEVKQMIRDLDSSAIDSSSLE